MVGVVTYRGKHFFGTSFGVCFFYYRGGFVTTVKVVIAGCRHYNDYEEAKTFIDKCLQNIRKDNTIIIVSGGCRGADRLGEIYAEENGFQIIRFLPDWEKYGKSAGPKRNKQMAEESDYVICFWDGKSKGTKTMIDYAKMHNRPLRIKRL